MKKPMEEVTVYGIDIGKNNFHIIGLDVTGRPILQTKFGRDRLLQYFAKATTTIIGMESCPGSQWLARKLQTMGHTVKIIPAQFVKPYVKSNKNDMWFAGRKPWAASLAPCHGRARCISTLATTVA